MQCYPQLLDNLLMYEQADETDAAITMLLSEIRCRDRRMESMETGIADLHKQIDKLNLKRKGK